MVISICFPAVEMRASHFCSETTIKNNQLKKNNHRYLIHTWLDKAFKDTIEIWALIIDIFEWRVTFMNVFITLKKLTQGSGFLSN